MTATENRLSESRSGGPSLGTRIFLTSGLLILLAVAAAVLATSWFGGRIANQAAIESLESSAQVQEVFEANRYESLDLRSRALADGPYLVAYVAEAGERADLASMLDILQERQNDYGFDLALLLDPEGTLIVHTARPDASGEDLQGEPLVSRAVEEGEAFGLWQEGEAVYSAVAVPLVRGVELLGYLITGYLIDDDLARDIQAISSTDVALLVPDEATLRVASTTLDGSTVTDLLQRLEGLPTELTSVLEGGERVERLELELDGRSWLALLSPLSNAIGEPVGVSASLVSRDRILAPFRRITRILLAVGLASIVLALLASYFLSQRILRPVSRLVAAADRARAGDYDQSLPIEGGAEVGRLGLAFDDLLRSLREQRDMQDYLGKLARTLPDASAVVGSSATNIGRRQEATGPLLAAQPSESALAGEPARTANRVLLSVELRGYTGASRRGTAAQVVERLGADLGRLTEAATARQGQVEALLGHRLLLSFEGVDAPRSALATAAEAQTMLFPEGSEATPVVALTLGDTVKGEIDFALGRRSALVGLPVQEAENLLREAAPGEVVFSKRLGKVIESDLASFGIEARLHRSLVSSQEIFVLPPESLRGIPSQVPKVDGGTMAVTTALDAEALGAAIAGPGTDQPTATPASLTGGAAPISRPPSAPTPSVAPVIGGTLSSIDPGQVLGDRFEILGVLGSGGMGQVYKARDRDLDDIIGLKMLRREFWGDQELLARLKEELKLARKVTHPNVLRTHDFGDLGGMPYISMEYVRGVTLRYLLDRSDRLPFTAGLRLARQLCDGLQAAHEVGVIHRDIKPENLIIEPMGNAKLMDFGIARALEGGQGTVTSPGMVIGTPLYLSPEQLQGGTADARSDLYSAGVVLYELFTGTLPFRGGSLNEILIQHLQTEPTPPSELWPEIPPELEVILLRSLAKNPAERFQSAAEVSLALDRIRG